ncbi:vitamin K-dependent protein C-like isoform X1 [Limulus polyphemus]|uniref:Vitamin K-dependent protein C-like isoform X1 n=1 Tax=Limulus polyphemus TaxID=6850 RepID=A0ABM1T8D0_LIMPO|nr:vitamin K-dependent protein C-like isoform X1 [Limulus polyphemus]
MLLVCRNIVSACLLSFLCIVLLETAFTLSNEAECVRPASPSNGRVWFRFRGGLSAIFTCSTGYVLIGQNVSSCMNGKWNYPPPTCQEAEIRCEESYKQGKIEEILAKPHEELVLGCNNNKHQGSQPVWFKDNTIIDILGFTNIQVLPNSSLLLEVYSVRDQGLYYCLTQSSESLQINRAVRIRILEEKQPTVPVNALSAQECFLEFRNQMTKLYVRPGSTALLHCDVNDPTASVSWFVHGQHIESDDRIGDIGQGKFQIMNFTASDSGIYSCIVQTLYDEKCKLSRNIEVAVEQQSVYPVYTCGRPLEKETRRKKRIIDGVRAPQNSAPWMCMLSTEKVPVVCGCSLISDKWIATAAHCFNYLDSKGVVTRVHTDDEARNNFFIKLGKVRRSPEPEEVYAKIRHLVIHPNFRSRIRYPGSNPIINNNDIALVQLEERVAFKPNVLPVCLPMKGFLESFPIGSLGMVTGWGSVSVQGATKALTLQQANLPLVARRVCADSSSYTITENMFCAGYAESYKPDTCGGDSGGPYIMKFQGRWYLAGIVSWGEGCSSPRKYGVYTKVENFLSWIRSTIAEN